MKRLIVNPTPARQAMPSIDDQELPVGSLANFVATARAAAEMMPSGFPTIRPTAIASGRGEMRLAGDSPCNGSPAFAKANKGKMRNLT